MGGTTMRTLTISLDKQRLANLDALAERQNRSLEEVALEALDKYLDEDAWFRAEVQKGLDAAERGEWVTQEEMDAEMARLGIHVG